MATTAFTNFLPEVLPQVPGCSDLLATNAVRNACIEFCSNTLFWQETQDPITVSDTDFPLDLDAPAGATVIQVMSVQDINGHVLPPHAIDWLDNNVVNWRATTAQMPGAYYMPSPNQIALVPSLESSATATLTLRVAYTPTRIATGVDSTLHQSYLEEIAAGALSRLFSMVGHPWHNPGESQRTRQMFNTAMTSATIEANKTYGRGGMQVQLRRFG